MTNEYYSFLKSPTQTNNLVLSLPHRLLVAALRRKAIVGIESVAELLDGNIRRIRFKDEFLNLPIALRGTPRGLDVIPDQPATVIALSEYLQRRGENLGYPEPITFYAIRRRAATNFTEVFGADSARAIMNHDPDTRIMEQHYLDLFRTTNMTAAALGEGAPAEQQEEMNEQANYLALNRLGPQRVSEIYGAPLNAAVRKLILTDDKYWEMGTTRERKNRERVLRRSALQSLMEIAHQEQSDTMTVQEMKERKQEVMEKMTLFNTKLLEMAKKAAETDLGTGSVGDVQCDEDFEEIHSDVEDAEADADDQMEAGGSVNVDEESFLPQNATDEEGGYFEAVRYTMNLLYDNSLNEYSIKQRAFCPLCVDDDTVDQEAKQKLWAPNHIKRHMDSMFHTDYGAFQRRAEMVKADNEAPGFVCEFCVLVHPEGWEPVYYPGFSQLNRHINDSTAKGLRRMQNKPEGLDFEERSANHETRKEEAGWNRDDFRGDRIVQEKEKQERVVRARRNLALDQPAFRFTDEAELEAPIPVPGQPGLFYGSFNHPSEIPEHMAGVLSLGPIPGTELDDVDNDDGLGRTRARMPKVPLTPYQAAGITIGPVPTGPGPTRYDDIPPHQAHMIKKVPFPGTEGNREKDGLWVKHRLLAKKD